MDRGPDVVHECANPGLVPLEASGARAGMTRATKMALNTATPAARTAAAPAHPQTRLGLPREAPGQPVRPHG
jgi:hypothetical protein